MNRSSQMTQPIFGPNDGDYVIKMEKLFAQLERVRVINVFDSISDGPFEFKAMPRPDFDAAFSKVEEIAGRKQNE